MTMPEKRNQDNNITDLHNGVARRGYAAVISGSWQPIPSAPKDMAPRPPLDVTDETLRGSVIYAAAVGLSKRIRAEFTDGARDLPKSSVADAARAAAEAAGLKGLSGLDFIVTTIEAPIQYAVPASQ